MSVGICFSADKTRSTEAAGEDHTDLWLSKDVGTFVRAATGLWQHCLYAEAQTQI